MQVSASHIIISEMCSNIEHDFLATLTDRLNALVAQAIDDVVGCEIGGQILQAPREAVRLVLCRLMNLLDELRPAFRREIEAAP